MHPSAVLVPCAGYREGQRGKEGGTQFSHSMLSLVRFGSRLGCVRFCFTFQSMYRLKRIFGFLWVSLWWVGVGHGGEQGVADLEDLCWQSYMVMVQPWGLPCPCGPSVTAAVGPGRLFPLGLVLNLSPESSSPPNAGKMCQSRLAGARTVLRGLALWQRAQGSRKG